MTDDDKAIYRRMADACKSDLTATLARMVLALLIIGGAIVAGLAVLVGFLMR